MTKIKITPVAKSMPFDNSTNGFSSANVQGAIEEGYVGAANASRGPTVCGFNGTASAGRWLEFFSKNPSNDAPFVLAEDSELIAVSLVSSSSSSTGTVSIFKNGVSIQSISLTSQKKNAISGLSHSISSLDELSVQVTAGSIFGVTVYMFIRTLA